MPELQTVTTDKKRGRSRGPHQKPASNSTTRINGAEKRKAKARKAKAGGARGPSQVTKNRNKHSKQQALSVGAAHSHSNSPATVKSKAKDSGRNSIENVSARRGSASSSISHPKASTLTPATPRPQPLSPISSMKAKPRNSKQQRKLPPPSGSLKPPTHTSRTNLPTIAARSISQSRKNSKGENPSRRITPSLSHARADAQSSQPSSPLHAQYTAPKHNILPGRNPNSRGTLCSLQYRREERLT
ncbi:hypothetical protein CCMSSC00406_0006884 [Pleurotus cornucopiae]|uniref:Uncharacterized protein n=1 Tax=Pleurotus cornucopiae TaxID=5321 RepID=A0ACB7IQ23_PLECO|nr:hypothetical protein CCMSSC00406_0006884 [Pleurotus cornucopiae]